MMIMVMNIMMIITMMVAMMSWQWAVVEPHPEKAAKPSEGHCLLQIRNYWLFIDNDDHRWMLMKMLMVIGSLSELRIYNYLYWDLLSGDDIIQPAHLYRVTLLLVCLVLTD